jgi:hypothetical protein
MSGFKLKAKPRLVVGASAVSKLVILSLKIIGINARLSSKPCKVNK